MIYLPSQHSLCGGRRASISKEVKKSYKPVSIVSPINYTNLVPIDSIKFFSEPVKIFYNAQESQTQIYSKFKGVTGIEIRICHRQISKEKCSLFSKRFDIYMYIYMLKYNIYYISNFLKKNLFFF